MLVNGVVINYRLHSYPTHFVKGVSIGPAYTIMNQNQKKQLLPLQVEYLYLDMERLCALQLVHHLTENLETIKNGV